MSKSFKSHKICDNKTYLTFFYMTVIVTIPDSAITLGSSQFSEQLYALKDNAEFRGARKEPQGENVVYYISPEKMPISAMRTVVENG